MPSLYLGTLADIHKYEIHAFTSGLPWREYASSEIADHALYGKMLEGRYQLLESGRPIYCTAIRPDIENRVEKNPHDSREGTVHIVALDSDGRIRAALSVAVDIGSTCSGEPIGVPLENRWLPGTYPMGASLDNFGARYLSRVYGGDRPVQPWEMAELYRHYSSSTSNGIVPRLGLYTGLIHLAVRQARKTGHTPTWLWVFDAIPQYFNLYKLAGAAVLRDLTIETPARLVSPPFQPQNNSSPVQYKGHIVSRNVPVPIPNNEMGHLQFVLNDVPFLDGVVDIQRLERMYRDSPLFLNLGEVKEFSLRDRLMLRCSLALTSKQAFDTELAHKSFARQMNRLCLRKLGVANWTFRGTAADVHASDLGRSEKTFP